MLWGAHTCRKILLLFFFFGVLGRDAPKAPWPRTVQRLLWCQPLITGAVASCQHVSGIEHFWLGAGMCRHRQLLRAWQHRTQSTPALLD